MFAAYFDVVGHTLEIAKIEAKHIGTLWTILHEEENTKLYSQFYSTLPASQEDFGKTLLASSEHDQTTKATRAIINKCTSEVLGWLIVNSKQYEKSEERTAEGVVFLPRALRSERGTESIYNITHILFDRLGYDRFEFRAGTLTEAWGPGGGQLGRSLIGVLSRQMLDRSRSTDSDLYVVRKAEWPAVSLAVGAWLDSKVSTSVEGSVGILS